MADENRSRWVVAGWLLLGAIPLQALGLVGDVVTADRFEPLEPFGDTSWLELLFAASDLARMALLPLLGALLLALWVGDAAGQLRFATALGAALLAVVALSALVLSFAIDDQPFSDDWAHRATAVTSMVGHGVMAAVALNLGGSREPRFYGTGPRHELLDEPPRDPFAT